jgi:hypothetical protein
MVFQQKLEGRAARTACTILRSPVYPNLSPAPLATTEADPANRQYRSRREELSGGRLLGLAGSGFFPFLAGCFCLAINRCSSRSSSRESVTDPCFRERFNKRVSSRAVMVFAFASQGK